jgi:hypothetical protein
MTEKIHVTGIQRHTHRQPHKKAEISIDGWINGQTYRQTGRYVIRNRGAERHTGKTDRLTGRQVDR